MVRAREEGHAGRRELARARVRQRRRHAARDPLGRRRRHHGLRRPRVSRLRRLVGPADLGPRAPEDRRGRRSRVPPRHVVRRAVPARDRARRGGRRCVSRHRAGAVRVVGHRSRHERRAARARRDGPRSRREILRLLPRPRRLSARRRRLGARDVRPAVLARRAERARGADARAAARRHGGRRETVRGRGRPHRGASSSSPCRPTTGCCCSAPSS